MPEIDLYAVVGQPILHSRSPQIFQTAFADCSMNAAYVRLFADTAQEAMRIAQEMNISGFNVTQPFKETIIEYLDTCDQVASKIGAVNTVVRNNKELHGCNTDWLGVSRALTNHRVKTIGCSALVLGAGGAAKAAAWGIRSLGASEVIIANRNLHRARQAAEKIGCSCCTLDEINQHLKNTDVLISCLPAGVKAVKQGWLHEGLVVLDANYANSELEEIAGRAGCQFISGLDWLNQQALESFKAFKRCSGQSAEIESEMREINKVKNTRLKDKTNIALVGFMGTGKTTVGELLASRLEMPFFDSDAAVEKTSGKTVAEIFKGLGEPAFRRQEKSILEAAVQSSKTVIACGGGALMDNDSLRLVKERCKVVWLWSSIEEIINRAVDDSRPLLNCEQPLSRIRELMARRRFGYAQAADLVIGTVGANPAEIAGRIEHEICRSVRN